MKKTWIQFRPGVFAVEGETTVEGKKTYHFKKGQWGPGSQDDLPEHLRGAPITGDIFFQRGWGATLPESLF